MNALRAVKRFEALCITVLKAATLQLRTNRSETSAIDAVLQYGMGLIGSADHKDAPVSRTSTPVDFPARSATPARALPATGDYSPTPIWDGQDHSLRVQLDLVIDGRP